MYSSQIRLIDIGPDGSVRALDANPASGGHSFHHWNGGGWVNANGGTRRITVARDGTPWMDHSNGGPPLCYARGLHSNGTASPGHCSSRTAQMTC